MHRIPEPELMLGDEQVRAYAAADFEDAHGRLLALLRTRLADLQPAGRAADLGCGPGDIAFRFARAFPGWTVDAVDGSEPMLAVARRLVVESGLAARVGLHHVRLPAAPPVLAGYDLVLSNSLLHHLADPGVLWDTVRRWAAPGAFVFVMDLLRPADVAGANALVDRYAAAEPEALRRDFLHSLLAAYTMPEVRAQLEAASLGGLRVEVVSDRHFIVSGPLPV